jgi:hypothetical protein
VFDSRQQQAFIMRTHLLLLVLLGCSSGISATDGLRPWKDYRTILWMGGSVQKNKERWPVMFERLRELGINTTMVGRDDDPKPFIDAGFGYYVENVINKGLCLKFSSSVTNWSKFIDEWSKTRDEKAFVRDYSFDDSAWRESVFDVMRKAARHHAPFGPVAYDLRDELSVTISANPFDYDFSPTALAGFREWLKTQYPSLAALNEQWETDFPSWDAVMPFSTDRIKARMVTGERMPKGPPDWSKLKEVKFDPAQAGKNPTRWNFSPWCDHRTYMDISLARTLDGLRKEAHKLDPQTPVGIEGTQMPHAFGGYDLWRLSQAVDWMEPYDVCNSREILASFMPGKPIMSTVFENDTNAAQRRLWHLLLLGDRGCVVWWSEDAIDWTKPDLPLTAKGQALAPVLKQMTSPLAKLFMLAEKEYDPIAIHYSQPSIQIAWLLESTVDGKTWPRRFSSFEGTHNKHAQVRNGWLKTLQDCGFTPRFVSSHELGSVNKKGNPTRSIILPESSAVSVPELQALQRLAANPDCTVIKSGLTGLFDEHGRPRTTTDAWLIEFKDRLDGTFASTNPPHVGDFHNTVSFVLPDIKAPSRARSEFVGDYPSLRLQSDRQLPDSWVSHMAAHLSRTQLRAAVRIPPSARVLTHRYKLGTSRLLAFERNIEWKMSENLKQAGGNAELEKPVTFTAEWDEAAEVVDLWTGKRLGRTKKIEVNLDPWRPSFYALLSAPVEGDIVAELLRASAVAK